MMFRVYDPEEDKYREGCTLNEDGVAISSWGKDKPDWIIQLNSGFKDSYGEYIFDGDYLSIAPLFSGTVVFKNGGFFVKNSLGENRSPLYCLVKGHKISIVDPNSNFGQVCLTRKNGRLVYTYDKISGKVQ